MPLPIPNNPDQFRRLAEIMECLLSDEGCPWDRKQTHETLKPYVIEESYEVCEAIDQGEMQELKGELGDLGLQIVFHSALAKRAGHFDVDDVYRSICEKLIRRHPHVFGDTEANDAGVVLRNWEAIKRAEREAAAKGERRPSALDGVPAALPGLQRAHRLQTKAARVGFDWGEMAPVLAKIREEIDELEAEIAPLRDEIVAPVNQRDGGTTPPGREKLAGELGDLLFAIVNLARFLQIDPEQAIQQTNRKFLRRFHYIEQVLAERGTTPAESTLAEMDAIWEESKRALPAEG
ncbi:nucleoside triphosphate pyrophosphohydrolase [bacterium]|nr:nucleoside triphosphate pyrophosphohydrolase [bacterium]